MADPKELLAQMGITPEDVDKHWDRKNGYRAEDRVVCLCGHGKGRHVIEPDFVTCNPSKVNCSCGNFVPVLKVQDTRDFLSKTRGHGIDHALVKGIFGALNRGEYVEWIDTNYVCLKCKTSGHETELTITPFEGDPETGLRPSIQLDFSRWNFFLCETCKEQK